MDTAPEQSIFDNLHDPFAVRRRYMLPKWIRVFCWIFAVLGLAGAVMSLICLFTNMGGEYTIYGLSSYSGLSFTGLMITGVYLLKGITAIGLLTEKDWAVKCAIADGIIGIVLCSYSLIADPWVTHVDTGTLTTTHYNFRLELLFLIPYLMKMVKIRKDWEDNIFVKQQVAG